MRKILILLMILALVGCSTGYKISKLKNGMGEDEATKIMGKPDLVEERGEFVVLKYEDRLRLIRGGYPHERVDYYVIVRNGIVVDFGITEIRLGCEWGDKICKLKKGMSEDRATSIMGKPDRVRKRGEYVVFRYEDRPIGGYSSERVDHYVIVRNGLVVDYGIGEIRRELPPPEEKCNARLGSIGVVPALFLPEAEVNTPKSAAKEGAEQGAVTGAGVGGGAPCPVCVVTVPIGAFIGASTGCLVGMTQGQIQDVPDDEVEEMRGVITGAIGELNIQEAMSVHVSKTAWEISDCKLDLLRGKGPASPDEQPNYGFLKEDGIDSVLEVSVKSFGFKSGPGENPNIHFFMTAHCRFMRTGDEEKIFSKDFHWISDKYLKLADYVDDDSRLLRQEFDRSCEELSERIVRRLGWEH
jgi:hypothetical protein